MAEAFVAWAELDPLRSGRTASGWKHVYPNECRLWRIRIKRPGGRGYLPFRGMWRSAVDAAKDLVRFFKQFAGDEWPRILYGHDPERMGPNLHRIHWPVRVTLMDESPARYSAYYEVRGRRILVDSDDEDACFATYAEARRACWNALTVALAGIIGQSLPRPQRPETTKPPTNPTKLGDEALELALALYNGGAKWSEFVQSVGHTLGRPVAVNRLQQLMKNRLTKMGHMVPWLVPPQRKKDWPCDTGTDSRDLNAGLALASPVA